MSQISQCKPLAVITALVAGIHRSARSGAC
jgi:hypothetical protein